MRDNTGLSMRVIFKFILPAMGILTVVVLSNGTPQNLWSVLPLLLIVSYLSAAEIRTDGKQTYYRRWRSWKKLPVDVTDIRCSVLPAMGYVKFRSSMRPLGSLHYIVERDDGYFIPFRQTPGMRAIFDKSRVEKRPESSREGVEAEEVQNGSRIGWTIATIAGAVIGLVAPIPERITTLKALPHIVAEFLIIQSHPIFLISVALFSVALLVRNRFRGGASLAFAFLLGCAISRLVHWQ